MKKKFGLLMLISTGILLGLTGCGAEKLDMNQFVTYEFVGYDGYGSVVSDFDDKEFISELVLLADPDKNIDESDAKDILGWDEPLYDELSAGDWIDNGSISNGDSTTFKWSMSDSYKKRIKEKTGVKLITDDYKIEVDGLKNPEEFNINDYVKFKVEGDAPNGVLKTKKSSELKDWPNFSYSKKDNLSNGDEIEISIGKSKTEFEEFRKANGLPEFDQKFTYEVKGVRTRLTTIDDISEELLNGLKEESQPHIEQRIENYDDNASYSLCAYGFSASEEDGMTQNIVIVIYKIENPNAFMCKEYYQPVVYENVCDTLGEKDHGSLKGNPIELETLEEVKTYFAKNYNCDIQLRDIQ